MLTLLSQATSHSEPTWFTECILPLLRSIVVPVVSAVAAAVVTTLLLRKHEFRRFRKEHLWQKTIAKYDELIAFLQNLVLTFVCAAAYFEQPKDETEDKQYIAFIKDGIDSLTKRVLKETTVADDLLSAPAAKALSDVATYIQAESDDDTGTPDWHKMSFNIASQTFATINTLREERRKECA